jgi:hypothetical protein
VDTSATNGIRAEYTPNSGEPLVDVESLTLSQLSLSSQGWSVYFPGSEAGSGAQATVNSSTLEYVRGNYASGDGTGFCWLSGNDNSIIEMYAQGVRVSDYTPAQTGVIYSTGNNNAFIGNNVERGGFRNTDGSYYEAGYDISGNNDIWRDNYGEYSTSDITGLHGNLPGDEYRFVSANQLSADFIVGLVGEYYSDLSRRASVSNSTAVHIAFMNGDYEGPGSAPEPTASTEVDLLGTNAISVDEFNNFPSSELSDAAWIVRGYILPFIMAKRTLLPAPEALLSLRTLLIQTNSTSWAPLMVYPR